MRSFRRESKRLKSSSNSFLSPITFLLPLSWYHLLWLFRGLSSTSGPGDPECPLSTGKTTVWCPKSVKVRARLRVTVCVCVVTFLYGVLPMTKRDSLTHFRLTKQETQKVLKMLLDHKTVLPFFYFRRDGGLTLTCIRVMSFVLLFWSTET